jgi:PAS domain-containing protein
MIPWSGNNNYATPDYLYQALDMEFGFDLDPCPLNADFDPEFDQDGLKLNWDGRRVFCNPPWSDITPWVQKAYESRALVVFLLPSRSDTAWFHLLQDSGAELRFFRKRIRFIRNGQVANSPADGAVIAVVRRLNIEPPAEGL